MNLNEMSTMPMDATFVVVYVVVVVLVLLLWSAMNVALHGAVDLF